MKGIFITGAGAAALQGVSSTLMASGMKPAVPALRGEPVDLDFWHEQVFAAAPDDAQKLRAAINPSRLWDQMASDIFVANIKSEVWGWAGTRCTWLLDYWLEFEPRLNFILVVVSPQQALASALFAQGEPASVDTVVSQWQLIHQELLRFYHRNSKRCLLVDAEDCARNPQALVDRCNQHWQLDLVPADVPEVKVAPHGALGQYLAYQLSKDYPQSTSLQHEILATAARLGLETVNPAEPGAPELAVIVEDYRLLLDRSAEQAQLHQLCSQLETQGATHAQSLAELAGAQQQAVAINAAHQKENELLLLQLHQVQEELEQYVLKSQPLQSQLDAVRQEQQSIFHTAAQERSHQDAIHAALKAELAEAREALRVAEQHNANLQLQLSERHDHEAAQSLLHQKSLTDLAAQHEAALQQDQTQHQHQLKEQQKEGELLLLQLHQVQEELEHYFLQHQDAQQRLATAEQRWLRMLERTPDYCDYESLEVLPTATAGQTHWRIKNLNASGRSLPMIEFKSLLHDGIAGYLIEPASGTTGLLRRWPGVAADQPTVTVLPASISSSVDIVMTDTLRQIATTDWKLLQTLTHLLGKALADPQSIKAPKDFDPQAVRAGLGNLALALHIFPATLRFDDVRLKREQVNPDYEHLWIELTNLSLGNQSWPAFEFRLSCANVRPKHFGGYPKLEFPQTVGQVPFESWFEETYDDFGSKLELRFALPEAMDIGVWQRLSDSDHGFLQALVQQLPAILGSLQSAGTRLKRPWVDWQMLATELQRILTVRCAALQAPVETPPPKPAKSKRSGRKGVAA